MIQHFLQKSTYKYLDQARNYETSLLNVEVQE